jgi:folate-dependent tRNA-U54 methylase TrmFO/GidA
MGASGRGIVKLEGERKQFNSVKVFSATMAPDRDGLGDKVTNWLRNHPNVQVTDTIVTQSSDAAFHCLAITLFYWEEPK